MTRRSVEASTKTPWFDGPTLLEHLETVPVLESAAIEALRVIARAALVLPVPVPRVVVRMRGGLGQILVGFGHGTAPGSRSVGARGSRRLPG